MRARCSRWRDRAVDEGCRQLARSQGIHLVLHQRNQWGDNHCRAIQHHRRQLIAERLAAAGGHDHHGVFAFEDCLDHFALTFAEVIESKMCAQRCEGISKRMHSESLRVSDLR